MFQDIKPYEFHNQYHPRKPQDDDYVMLYKENQVLLIEDGAKSRVPQYHEIKKQYPELVSELAYLLSVNDTAFYLTDQEVEETEMFRYSGMFNFREMEPDWLAFTGATAFHLARWYDSHRYCGRCTARMVHKKDERALVCPECKLEEYPKIAPVVMVGIRDGEHLLLTKYAHAAYKRHALVAGFAEIGETLEEAVEREVMEEVGLKLKNISYYKSQPWAFSESLLAGFFADVDGSTEVVLDENELAEAEWFLRTELPETVSTMSLTWDMIEAFRAGLV